MDLREELLLRVRDDADAISQLANGGTNIPLDEYIDKVSLTALCDSLALDPKAWQTEDLERILVIRDGLYKLRNHLRDTDPNAEHSVDRVLSAFDRLYADLERAFRELNQEELKKAQAEVAALQRGPHIATSTVSGTASEMTKEASEVLVQAHTSIKHIEFNLLKIDRSNANFEVLSNVKLSVQRLSASVFAIKLSLEQGVIYQGIFKLLTDGADRIVDELRRLVRDMRQSYETAQEFIAELGGLAEKGTRFARLVANFLSRAFARTEATEETIVTLRVQTVHQGEAILAASADSAGKVVLAGKNGNAWIADAGAARFVPRYRLTNGPVFCLAHINDELLAIGTNDGLEVKEFDAPFRERVTAVAIAPWGAKGTRGAIITGSADGVVRRLWLAGGLSQVSDDAYERVGKRVKGLVVHGFEVIAANGTELVFLDQQMRTKKTMRVPFDVNGMVVAAEDTVVLCGEGHLTQVNLQGGTYSRILTASNDAEYSCVAPLDGEKFYFGTADGRVGVMELASGEELGSVKVEFELKGIVQAKKRVIAYGGEWKERGRCAAIITMESVTRPIGGPP